MVSAEELKRKWFVKNEQLFEEFIMSAHGLGMNYVFIDRNSISSDLIDKLRMLGYTVVIGQGEASRIKISW